jgi:hypothetical protein
MAGAGSVEYLDPALLRGERPSRATEVFALGATLHRALTGTGLYGELPDGEPLAAIRRVMSTEPVIAAGLTAAEAELVRACLAPVGQRPATARQVARRLEALAAPAPAHA